MVQPTAIVIDTIGVWKAKEVSTPELSGALKVSCGAADVSHIVTVVGTVVDTV